MNRTLRSALVAVLAVAAVAFAATTLDSTVTPEQATSGGDGFTAGGGEGGFLPVPRVAPTPGAAVEIPYLREILTVLAVLGALAALLYALLDRREALRAVAFGVAIAVGAYLLYRLFEEFQPDGLLAGNGSVPPGNGSVLGGAGGSAPTTQFGPPPLVVLLVVGLAIAAAGVALAWYGGGGFGRGDGEADEAAEHATDGTAVSAAAVGRAAGRAADRIEATTDVDNEVYRAWREMTELLDVEAPETSTPGEFAAAAVDAGLGRDDVRELTRLFEDVRYGDAAVSADDEERATAVLRRIEGRYAEAES
jgi:hypothetical protein